MSANYCQECGGENGDHYAGSGCNNTVYDLCPNCGMNGVTIQEDLDRLKKKLREIISIGSSDEFRNVFVVAKLHGMEYTGRKFNLAEVMDILDKDS